MDYKTITGRRPDLEGIPVNTPQQYIGSMIFPVLNVMEKTGTIYFRAVTGDTAAQTGRNSGTAPTATLLTDSSTTYSVAEAIKRYAVDKAEVQQMGGIEEADKLGGTAAKRSVMRAMESAQAAILLDSTSYSAASDISSAIIDGIIGAAESVKRYTGKLAFVCSTTVYRWLIQQTEIKNLLLRSFGGLTSEQAMSLSPAVFKATLQGLFMFDEILIGDDDHWSITGQEDAAAVVKLPPPEGFSHKMDPVLGKTVLYLPDGSQPFEIESFYDDDDKLNKYDATSWYLTKQLNSGAKKLVKGLGTATT
jgi:hypothetical protein